MKIVVIDQNSPEWLEARKGKITGSKLNGIITHRGDGKKLGFYELIAEKLSIVDESEDGRDRGHQLEDEGIAALSEKIGVKFEKVGLCVHDEYEEIANSPDGLSKEGDKYTIGAEVKCLSGARHIQAWHTKKLDNDYYYQMLQYFIVNPDLHTLYFAFYDPRLTAFPIHYMVFNRDDIADEIEKWFTYQVEMLQEVNQLVEQLSF